MLSREHVIHRSAGEEREWLAVRGVGDAYPAGGRWGKFVVLVLLIAVAVALLLLNRTAAVDPGVKLVLFTVARPSLVAVLSLTFLAGAGVALLARSVFRTRTRAVEAAAVRSRSGAGPFELDGAATMRSAAKAS
jgi:hypothetical protein